MTPHQSEAKETSPLTKCNENRVKLRQVRNSRAFLQNSGNTPRPLEYLMPMDYNRRSKRPRSIDEKARKNTTGDQRTSESKEPAGGHGRLGDQWARDRDVC